MGRHPHNVGEVRKKSKNPLGKAGDSHRVREEVRVMTVTPHLLRALQASGQTTSL